MLIRSVFVLYTSSNTIFNVLISPFPGNVYANNKDYTSNLVFIFSGRPAPSLHWLINGRPAPIQIVKDNVDPTDGLMSFTDARRTPLSKTSDYIASNSSLSSILPFKETNKEPTKSVGDLSATHLINSLPLKPNAYTSEITNNDIDKIAISQDIQNSETEIGGVVRQKHVFQVEGLDRAKKSSSLMSSLNDNTIGTNAQMHTNGFINRRGIRKGLVTSSLMIGAVQRKDVDTVYSCLASNSNMTQASRAAVKLQMNRK